LKPAQQKPIATDCSQMLKFWNIHKKEDEETELDLAFQYDGRIAY
jgi:hypothetical protein